LWFESQQVIATYIETLDAFGDRRSVVQIFVPPAHRGGCLVQAPRWGVSHSGSAVRGSQIGIIWTTERQKAESRPQAGLLAPELRIRVRSSDCGIARAPPPQQKQEGTAAGLRAAPPPARCQRLGANAAWPALPAIAQLAVLFLTRYVVVQSPVACCLDMSCSEMNTTSTSDRLATWRPLPLA
jgi:hypothetical protein